MEHDKSNIFESIKSGIRAEIRFTIRLVLVAVVVVGSYYLFSPYHNCVRDGYNPVGCIRAGVK
jgi:hypothetical protein